jgi:hypothetical protein
MSSLHMCVAKNREGIFPRRWSRSPSIYGIGPVCVMGSSISNIVPCLRSSGGEHEAHRQPARLLCSDPVPATPRHRVLYRNMSDLWGLPWGGGLPPAGIQTVESRAGLSRDIEEGETDRLGKSAYSFLWRLCHQVLPARLRGVQQWLGPRPRIVLRCDTVWDMDVGQWQM